MNIPLLKMCKHLFTSQVCVNMYICEHIAHSMLHLLAWVLFIALSVNEKCGCLSVFYIHNTHYARPHQFMAWHVSGIMRCCCLSCYFDVIRKSDIPCQWCAQYESIIALLVNCMASKPHRTTNFPNVPLSSTIVVKRGCKFCQDLQ